MNILYFVIAIFSTPVLLFFVHFFTDTQLYVLGRFYFLGGAPYFIIATITLLVLAHFLYVLYLSLCYKFVANKAQTVGARNLPMEIVLGVIYAVLAGALYIVIAESCIAFCGAMDGFGLFSVLFSLPILAIAYVISNILVRLLVNSNGDYFLDSFQKNKTPTQVFLEKFKSRFVLPFILVVALFLSSVYFYNTQVFNNVVTKLKTSEEIFFGDIIKKESVRMYKEEDGVLYGFSADIDYFGEKYTIQIKFPKYVFLDSFTGDKRGWEQYYLSAKMDSILPSKAFDPRIYIKNLINSDSGAPVYIKMLSNNTMEVVVGYPIKKIQSANYSTFYSCFIWNEYVAIGEQRLSKSANNSVVVDISSSLQLGTLKEEVKSKKYTLYFDVGRLNKTLNNGYGVNNCELNSAGLVIRATPYLR